MLRLFVDSGSSIKPEEAAKYNVEIIPLRYMMGEEDYLDGVNQSLDDFYKLLIEEKQFPKTSLPDLVEVQRRVDEYVEQGDDVMIVTISSKISGWHNAIKNIFASYGKVRVVDSLSAVGGIRLIVNEINKHRDESLDELVARVNKLVPKIRIYAIPEKLTWLLRGGRLTKKEWMIGSLLNVKPIISIINGTVTAVAKKLGIKNAMKFITTALEEEQCDPEHEIIPSYTYHKGNVEKLIEMTDAKYKKQMTCFDNLCPTIACHWGPNAFGYIFVSKN